MVWVALLLTGVRFEYRETNLWAHHLPNTKKFREASASKTVPTLSVPMTTPHRLSNPKERRRLADLHVQHVGAAGLQNVRGVEHLHDLEAGDAFSSC